MFTTHLTAAWHVGRLSPGALYDWIRFDNRQTLRESRTLLSVSDSAPKDRFVYVALMSLQADARALPALPNGSSGRAS